MKTAEFIRTCSGIGCVAFALGATAQTYQTNGSANEAAPPAHSETMGQRTMGERLDDGTITTKVKARLMTAKDVKSAHIHVRTRHGIVWLSGTVPTVDDKAEAADVAQTVAGVTGVRNYLEVAER